MADILTPALGESVAEASIAKWTKKVGDAVKKDEVLVELETDKVSLEVVAPADGVLSAINANEGDTVVPGAVLGAVTEGGAAAAPAPAPAAAAPAAAPAASGGAAVDIAVPTMGESVAEGSIGTWLKKSGDTVAKDELLVEIETDKVAVEVSAPAAGVLTIVADNGATVTPGQVIGSVAASGAAAAAAPAPAAAPANTGSAQAPASAHLSPAVQRVVSENNLNPAALSASGPKGNITKADAIAAIGAAPAAPAAAAPAAPRADQPREERVKMTRLRQTIARRLKESQNTAAQLTTFNEVDMTNVMALRAQYKEVFEKRHGVKLGFMSFFTKAVVQALHEIPAVNAEIDGTDIIYKNHYDIGIAVGTDKGLVVPVLRDADALSLAGIEKGIGALGKAARDGALTMDQMQGGTFTITNGGTYGSLMSTPILNAPQSGILGMHNIVQRPMAINGEVKIRPMMYLALSYDHRIVDGKEAVTFLVRIKELLEDPARALLDL
ncbi:2-oxoglutarate dehydrogenase complex dihydrolipoyllysine-residue succinyltransferase [Brevundimonas diminuta]|jgi:2-oxoglutarate dehydrogenase E2 component (dihydrolipoamide succinyltransferase)|uniref:Dihydrolipoyllysine-residue succinyltransferase component of 2-oxoglutarate dehydrogenase complex n=1 Tax=Brevundimonas diminuta TaxID=293 RepID=A0A410NUE6_BREDI|nr:2-oxoglutarate dehydrogenase complex dihydrolipoyllysine-residue succinyltransferase [Brevundimonas diminuta]MBD3571840.1 2-oxoglutarate dehydrogenase complex dihydrolipoyllysine-residue succinyltransferase [Brevundimonas diminuta]QAT13475.1 2-oxoglutarate dehydrogenase complex dihydrolipoyllysine-residue succinyltransferase [Brevundimonas diminuta]QQB89159.1 2-oxoglutarate dehydrogenase complex dihydrolipoyllysine-residue succinyltransferase [Brevundimonas diminuta]GEB99065.1 dihydrolipoyll